MQSPHHPGDRPPTTITWTADHQRRQCDYHLDPKTGLSQYCPDGVGIPPETEATHFTHVLEPYAAKHGLSVHEFSEKYNDGTLKEPELDEYFLHDRAVCEFGHDMTYHFKKRCANLGTIDLQALLYKYKVDIGTVKTTMATCTNDAPTSIT